MKRVVAALGLVVMLSGLVTPALAGNVKIGILPVLDTLPLQVAATENLFKKNGLDVELVPFQSALERDTAMKSGQLDGYFGDIIAALLLAKSGVGQKMVTVSWRTSAGQPMFGIVTSPQKAEGDLASLKGGTVGISASTIIEYLLDAILAKNKLSMDYFNRMEIKKVPLRFQALASNSIDMALLPEPLLSLGKFKGGKILFTDENLDMPLTVICLSGKLADTVTAKRFMAVYKEAVRRINADPKAYQELMAKTCRIPKPLIGNFPVYTYPAPVPPTIEEVRAVQKWMIGHAMLDKPLDLKELLP